MRNLWRKYGVEEYVEKAIRILYCCALLLGSILIILSFFREPFPQSESFLVFYADSIFRESGNWVAYILAFVVIGGTIYSVVGRAKRRPDDIRLEPPNVTREFSAKFSLVHSRMNEILKLGIPILFNLILFTYVVGHINAINRTRLVDAKLASIDHYLTGTYPFISLEMLRFPDWFVETIILSFVNLPFFLAFGAAVTYRKSRLVFSKFAIAFFTTIVLMLPVWLAVPVMSPQDRFIDNVYRLNEPPGVKEAIGNYAPTAPVKAFLGQMRRSKEGLAIMPTSTFPSSHAAWATIVMVYLFEASFAAGILTAPFLVLSTFGTFYLAQHYFVDAPAGVFVGLLSVLISSLLFSKWKGES